MNPLEELKLMVRLISEFKQDLDVEIDRLKEEIEKCHGREHSVKIDEEHWNQAKLHYHEMNARYVSMYKRIDAAIESRRKGK